VKRLRDLTQEQLQAFLLNAVRNLDSQPDKAAALAEDIVAELISRHGRRPEGKHRMTALGYNVQWRDWRAKERHLLLAWLMDATLPSHVSRQIGPPGSIQRRNYFTSTIQRWIRMYGQGPGMDDAVTRWRADVKFVNSLPAKALPASEPPPHRPADAPPPATETIQEKTLPTPDLKWVRCAVRVLRMVSELHRLGYQRVRAMPCAGLTSYRVWIAPAPAFSRVNGAFCIDMDAVSTCYDASAEDAYFGWQDARTDTARALARKFIERNERVCAFGQGSDWAYAGWLSDLLAMLERHPDKLPWIDLTDFTDVNPELMTCLPLRRIAGAGPEITPGDVFFPLPPVAA
jgi:hypothetical protein